MSEVDPRYTEPTDAARRIADVVNEALLGGKGRPGQWMAFSLADGRTDKVVYDRRDQAVSHNPDYCMYLQLQPGGIQARAAQTNFHFHRSMHASGMKLGDPDVAPVVPERMEHL